MRSNVKGVIFVIIAAVCWGVIGIFTRNLTAAGMTPMQMAFLRCAVAAVIMWVYVLCGHRHLARIDIKDIWMFIGTGVASVAMFNVLYFSTQQTTTLSVAAVLLYTAPIFVMLMSAVLFKERITKNKTFALALAFAGCVCVTGIIGSAGSIPALSIITGIGSGFCYALYSIFGTVALRKYDTITVTAYTFLFGMIAMFPASDIISLPGYFAESPDTFLNVVLLGVLATAVPYLFYTMGLKRVEPTRASTIAFIEPAVATITGLVVFGEQLTLTGIIGIVLIFISVLLLARRQRV